MLALVSSLDRHLSRSLPTVSVEAYSRMTQVSQDMIVARAHRCVFLLLLLFSIAGHHHINGDSSGHQL